MSNITATRISARWRIVGWIVLTTAVALLSVTATMRSVLLGQVIENADAQISQETEEFRAFAIAGIDPATGERFDSTSALVRHYLSLQTPSTGEAIIGVIGEQVLFIDNTSADGGELLANDRAQLSTLVESTEASGATESEQGPIRWGKVTVQSSTSVMPDAVLLVLHFTDSAQQRVDQEAVLLFAVALGGLLLTAGIAWLAAGRILQPLRQMNHAAAAITAHDLSARLPVAGRDDISNLAVTVNDMLDRIERAHSSQRHFVAEAQEHLSAPLRRAATALSRVIHVSQDEQLRTASALVTNELHQMQETLAALDVLAASDAPDFVRPSRVSVKEITAEIYADALAAYPHRRLELAEAAVGHGWLDATRVADALKQLLDNAVSHSEPQTVIQFGSSVADDQVTFWVTNHGERIHQDQAQAMFEVYRTTSHEDAEGGMGLGLAVVKAVADAHFGSAWVESDDSRTTVGITLPLHRLTPPRPLAEDED